MNAERCACGALALATTLSERHDRGLHGPDRCVGGQWWAQESLSPVKTALGEKYATATQHADLLDLATRWNAELMATDERLEDRIERTQRAVFHLTVAVILLSLTCIVLGTTVILLATS